LSKRREHTSFASGNLNVLLSSVFCIHRPCLYKPEQQCTWNKYTILEAENLPFNDRLGGEHCPHFWYGSAACMSQKVSTFSRTLDDELIAPKTDVIFASAWEIARAHRNCYAGMVLYSSDATLFFTSFFHLIRGIPEPEEELITWRLVCPQYGIAGEKDFPAQNKKNAGLAQTVIYRMKRFLHTSGEARLLGFSERVATRCLSPVHEKRAHAKL